MLFAGIDWQNARVYGCYQEIFHVTEAQWHQFYGCGQLYKS